MFFYKYQRSRSLLTLVWDASVSVFLSKIAGLIETKLQVEPLFAGEMKDCSWDQDDRHAYIWKKSSKISGTEWPMTLKLGLQQLDTRTLPSFFVFQMLTLG